MAGATFVAVYYPARGPPRSVLQPHYVLSEDELDAIRLKMRGVAVTYNHVGVAGALWRALLNQDTVSPTSIRAEFSKSTRPEESVLGQVEDAWDGPDGAQWCSFSLFAGESSGVAQMIISGLLRGVSLTHFRREPIVPLELSLCKTPARPQCSVRHISRNNFNGIRADVARAITVNHDLDRQPLRQTKLSVSSKDSPRQTKNFAAFNGRRSTEPSRGGV